MSNPHPSKSWPPGVSGTGGRCYPRLTCVTCGETKIATHFPKRGGPSYEKISQLDAKRYDTQCKKCKKPVPANAGPDYVHTEPPGRGAGGPRKKKPRKTRSDNSGLTAAERKQKICVGTRVKSMLYLSNKGCHKCGERDPRKLEYDHKNPADKHRGVGHLIVSGYSWASPVLRAEIRKCRVLCANCHRVHTIKQQGYYASDDVQRTLGEIAGKYGFPL